MGKVKAEEMETGDLLVSMERFLKSGVHIGAKFKTRFMDSFVYKIKPNGLCVLNISEINRRIKIAANFLSNYDPDEILVVCARDNGQEHLRSFARETGINAIPGRYLPGVLTNPSYEYYLEPKVVIVSDPWLDQQAIKDAVKSNIPIVGLCDTNNILKNIDFIIPCNNKGEKSLKLIYYLLGREYLKRRGKEPDFELDDF